jgi:hypothetical protein
MPIADAAFMERILTAQNERPKSESEPKPIGDPPPAPQPPAGDPPPHRPDAIPDEDLDQVEEQPS